MLMFMCVLVALILRVYYTAAVQYAANNYTRIYNLAKIY